MIEAALAYAEMDWPVFPVWNPSQDGGCACPKGLDCPSPAKHPLGDLVPRGVKNATTDPDTIRNWWTRRPEANIGLATGKPSGLIVLDVDPDKGGFEALSALIRRYGPLPETFVVYTGGGGLHFYFNHPGGHVPNSSGTVGPGLDIRGDGGYVLLPPSVHATRRDYGWQGAWDDE
jgi:hypothetical protein